MAQATVTFDLGSESVTSVLDIDLPTETIISGDFGGVVAAGTTARLRGSVRLIDNLHVRGTLMCDPTGVDLDGQNLYDIHTHDGGVLNLVGVEKSAWIRWGDTPVGWEVGDRLGVAPTVPNIFVPSEAIWQGSWAATTRPVNCPDKTLTGGMVVRPAVVNLSQEVIIRNVKRVMMHESTVPNVHTLKWLKVLNSGVEGVPGTEGVLGMYPVHFHLLADTCRGSLVEGVVVEGGKNHAFVPHGSHGITFRDVAAYKTKHIAFWWDDPEDDHDPNSPNNSDDILYEHALALDVDFTKALHSGIWHSLAAFQLPAGARNVCTDSVAAAVKGGSTSSGFNWPSNSSIQGGGDNVWGFTNNLSHNCKTQGLRVWQNDTNPHVISHFIAFNCEMNVLHGAYLNKYKYDHLTLDGSDAFRLHAMSRNDEIVISDVTTNGQLRLMNHSTAQPVPMPVRLVRAEFQSVLYTETGTNPNLAGSILIFEDCDLTPADFNTVQAHPDSTAEIWEGGVLLHRWQSGVWT